MHEGMGEVLRTPSAPDALAASCCACGLTRSRLKLPLALLQTSFDYPSQSDHDYESLDQSRAFPSNPPFEGEGSAASIFRPESYAPLSHAQIHPFTVQTAGGYDYRQPLTNPGRLEVP